MKRKNTKRRRGLRLALALIVLAVLGFFGWLAEGCPTFSRAGAFRRAQRNCALPETKLDVVLEQAGTWGDDIAIGVSENGASVVLLSERTHGWSGYGACYFPSVDGVQYVMMNRTVHYSYFNLTYAYNSPDDFQSRPAVVVKTDGARAELRLVLEDVTFYPVSERGKYFNHEGAVGGTWPLRALETKDGWTIFAFDSEVFPEGIRILDGGDYRTYQSPYEGSEAYWDAFYWMLSFFHDNGKDRAYVQPASFELTLYDEAGNAAKTVSWKP